VIVESIKQEDQSPGWPGQKSKTLFPKYSEQKGLVEWLKW
jgi:hypothetical protein